MPLPLLPALRVQLSEMGLVIVMAAIDRKTGEIIRGPEVFGRGVAHFSEGGELHSVALNGAREALAELSPQMRTMTASLEEALSSGVRRAFRRETGKRPAVLPMAVML